jgi:hypothetical protein
MNQNAKNEDFLEDSSDETEGGFRVDTTRSELNFQLYFCIGREGGNFLRRLMACNFDLSLCGYDLSDDEHEKKATEFEKNLERQLGVSGRASDKIKIYNHEFKHNKCSCGYYLFETGCDRCGRYRAG